MAYRSFSLLFLLFVWADGVVLLLQVPQNVQVAAIVNWAAYGASQLVAVAPNLLNPGTHGCETFHSRIELAPVYLTFVI